MEKRADNTLVYTNDRCIGCSKCISACNIINANQVCKTDFGYRVDVNGTNCINCGACLDLCKHLGRDFSDDTEVFFSDLKKGESITLLLAPAFIANYPDEYKSILGGLKKMGVKRIVSVSFGADITTWGYINHLKTSGMQGAISQPCPAIVNYIERYTPQLLEKLIPVHSPLLCAAIYLKKYMGVTDKLAFISPCIAKKAEIDDPDTGGYVSYNITFKNLVEYVHKNNISGPDASDEIEYGFGSIYPMPGGLKENVRWFCGDDVFVRQLEGEKQAYEFLNNYAERVAEGKKLPFLVDILNCEKGCIYGTGIEESKLISEDALYEIQAIKESSKNTTQGNPWNKNSTPQQRLESLNKQFEKLNLADFTRKYTDRSAKSKINVPNEEEATKIFTELRKYTDDDKTINCSSCGFDTCFDMVTAIHNSCNMLENCAYYMKMLVQEEQEQIFELSMAIEDQSQMILSSINYASSMQQNLLPREELFAEAFEDYSIKWDPRDVVGGDIYWMRNFEEGTLLCVCDCTGHGVSGAFITMLVATTFESTVTEKNYKDTAQVIWMLENKLVNVLNRNVGEGEIKDGCDLAVLYIANDGSVTISSGNTNVLVCNGKRVKKIKGQRIFVGEGRLESKDEIEAVTIPPNPENKFYVASDGLFDQRGSARPIPFGYKTINGIILENHNEKQEVISDKIWDAFEEYRGGEARTDDVQMITFKPKYK